jgi:hypothetical protein
MPEPPILVNEGIARDATHRNGWRVATALVASLALGHVVLGLLAPPTTHLVDVGGVAYGASAGWILRLGLAMAAALCFVLGPGVVLRVWLRPHSLLASTALVWIPGVVYLFAVGTIAWLLEFAISPQAVSTVLLVPIPLALLTCSLRAPISRLVPIDERVVLILVVLLVAIGIGRAAWSQGPTGELYGGTISRTLDADLRSDSRISYNVVMLAAHGDRPYGKVGRSYYAPYNFYARGPLAGLATAPVVLAGGATPPRGLPDQPWEPFDAQGFATYRIEMMLLNATVVMAAYGLLSRIVSARLAVAGATLVAMSPFVVREVYFTWPKLFAASFALAALVALLYRRPLVAGLLIGAAYLAHPSGLLALPTIVLVWAVVCWRGSPTWCRPSRLRTGSGWLRGWTRDAVQVAAGCFVIYAAWSLANRGHTVDYFTGYLRAANGEVGVPVGDWITFRLNSLANTLVPMRSYLTSGGASRIFNSTDPPRSPDILRFSFSYYNTLPFAVGLIYFPIYLYGLAGFARRSLALFLAAVVLPFLAFIVYWGAGDLGPLREGLHFIVVLSLLAAFVGHSIISRSERAHGVVRICATVRVVEVLFVVLVPTIATSHEVFGGNLFAVTDGFALALMIGGALSLGWITWRVLAPNGSWLSPSEPGPTQLAVRR